MTKHLLTKAAVVHFHGPKCGRDWKPFIENGLVSFSTFDELLTLGITTGDAVRLCREYDAYLEVANDLTANYRKGLGSMP